MNLEKYSHSSCDQSDLLSHLILQLPVLRLWLWSKYIVPHIFHFNVALYESIMGTGFRMTFNHIHAGAYFILLADMRHAN